MLEELTRIIAALRDSIPEMFRHRRETGLIRVMFPEVTWRKTRMFYLDTAQINFPEIVWIENGGKGFRLKYKMMKYGPVAYPVVTLEISDSQAELLIARLTALVQSNAEMIGVYRLNEDRLSVFWSADLHAKARWQHGDIDAHNRFAVNFRHCFNSVLNL